MFFKKQTSIDTIIVGLGNPGKKYEGTRHNAGFAALDHVAEKWGVRVTKAKFDALTGTGTAAGVKVLLMKPQTFMNLSGDAVRKAADFTRSRRSASSFCSTISRWRRDACASGKRARRAGTTASKASLGTSGRISRG